MPLFYFAITWFVVVVIVVMIIVSVIVKALQSVQEAYMIKPKGKQIRYSYALTTYLCRHILGPSILVLRLCPIYFTLVHVTKVRKHYKRKQVSRNQHFPPRLSLL